MEVGVGVWVKDLKGEESWIQAVIESKVTNQKNIFIFALITHVYTLHELTQRTLIIIRNAWIMDEYHCLFNQSMEKFLILRKPPFCNDNTPVMI